jgi:PLP dependent protein
MTMPPFYEDPERVRPYFRELRRIAEEITQCRMSRMWR